MITERGIEQYLHDDGYLVSIMPEKTGIEEVIEHYRTYEQNNDVPRNLRVFIDCSNSSFDFKPKDISRIWEAVDRCLAKYDSLEEAILVQRPYETAMAAIFENGAPDENYLFKLFSTREMAIDWLNRG